MLTRRENDIAKHVGVFGLLLVVLCFVAIACAAEQDFSIESKVDKPVVSADEVMTLSIVVKGTMKKPPQIKMPTLENFDVISSSRAFNIAVGKKKKRQLTFKIMYLLKPKSEGKFTIGPAEIEYKGKFYATDPIAVEIKPAGKKPEELKVPEEKAPEEGGFEIVI